mgnify:CR=1 FL=1
MAMVGAAVVGTEEKGMQNESQCHFFPLNDYLFIFTTHTPGDIIVVITAATSRKSQ